LTYGSILVEGLFPILVWFPKTKLYSIAAITSFHLGIALCLQNVTFFSLAMVCSFWVFVPSSSIRGLSSRFSLDPSTKNKKGEDHLDLLPFSERN